jgi:diguanylate cyclase (GGDEF)-like protein
MENEGSQVDTEHIENNITAVVDIIQSQFVVGAYGWYAAFLLLVLVVLIDFVRAAYGARKRSLESKQFLFLCVPIFLWATLHLSLAFFKIPLNEAWMFVLADALKAFILAMLCLHVWSQVSHKPITATTVMRYLVVPVLLLALAALLYYFPNINLGASLQEVGMQAAQQAGLQADQTALQDGLQVGRNVLSLSFLETLLFQVFCIVVVARAYLLCFNVFYQMPRHMRLSTHKMLLAISSVAIVWLLDAIITLPEGLRETLSAVSYIIVLYAFLAAFFIANSSNVIVTSREFVFSNLSTIVITVSLKGNILDWNKKGSGDGIALPKPLYKEPYKLYRERILSACNGVTSPHDENIITATIDGVEQHYLFTPHDIGFRGRNFGSLVEISEVTKIYSVLRYLEEIAMYDNLTGLKNRNAYIETVKDIVKVENLPLGIVVGDVNNLKKINDTLGHLYGDRLLTTIATIINEHMPENASAFRIGGDELALLIPRADATMVRQFVQEVTVACSEAEDPDCGAPSISWGCVLMTDISQDYNEVFLIADAMMYESKRANKVVSISGVVNTERLAPTAQTTQTVPTGVDSSMGSAADAELASGTAGADSK